MNAGQRTEADRLRVVPLEAVLRLSGAEQDREDHRKWRTAAGVLSVTGAKFINWNRGTGGGGAIDLVIHLQNVRFAAALDWLGRHFTSGFRPAPLLPVLPRQLQLPPPDPSTLARVQRYLANQRGIAPALINSLIRSGDVYADRRANAVFLLRDQDQIVVGAELRGTTAQQWRGMAPGSRKDNGFFAAPGAALSALILCESAIDALSCALLHPGHRCLSTSGARPNPPWLVPLLRQTSQVYCGFDADPTGDAMAAAMIALFPTVQRLRPARHDWNDVLRSQA
jgi:hypothetical protein